MTSDPDQQPRPLVDVVGLGRDYGELHALEELDLAVPHGSAVGFIGQNGSGKTTALSMIAGRLEPTRGTVRIGGADPHDPRTAPHARALVSFVPDAPALYSDLTVRDHLHLVGLAYDLDETDAIAEGLLDRLGLAGRSHLLPRELSRGMRQKTQLASALIRPFSVLMLDEPVSGLDPRSRSELHSLLVEAKEEGAAVLFSTHQFDFAEGLADHMIVLRDGAVAAQGTFDEVARSEAAKDLGLT